MSAHEAMLPRAPWRDVVSGRAALVGARMRDDGLRGRFSPVEPGINLGLDGGPLAAAEAALLGDLTPARALATALAALLTAPLAFDDHPRIERPYVVSARVHNVTVGEALLQIVEQGPSDRARMVHFVHPHALNVATHDASLRADLARADLVLPDGVGIRIAARLLGTPLTQNVNGTDLLPRLCAELVARDRPLALIGGRPGIATECATELRKQFPGLRVCGVEHGFVDAEAADAFARALAREETPPVVLVGLGTPLQEAFAWRHLASLRGASVVTVGGLFDFYSGRVRRAPVALRHAGLEWLHRLALEPRRMARRYVLGNPLFLGRALAQRLRTGTHAGAPAKP